MKVDYNEIIKKLESEGYSEEAKSRMVKKIFEILTDEDMVNKFLDFDNNKDCFIVCAKGTIANSASRNINEYILLMYNIFGDIDENGSLTEQDEYFNEHNIPNFNVLVENYKKIYNECSDNIKHIKERQSYGIKYRNRRYNGVASAIITSNEEPDWEVNEELTKAVYENFPNDLTCEEKAIYIYYKLCKLFNYDEGYEYKEQKSKDYLKRVNFSKENLEKISKLDKVICFEFARVYSKMINNLGENIEAAMLRDLPGHAFIVFSTSNCVVRLEPINVMSLNEDIKYNDLTMSKLGMELRGIELISGDAEVFQKAKNKIFTMKNLKETVKTPKESIEEYIQKLGRVTQEECNENLFCDIEFIKVFLNNMDRLNIKGSELTLIFNNLFRYMKKSDERIESSYIGKKNDKNKYERMIWLRNSENNNMYVIDTNSLAVKEYTEEEMRAKLDSGEYKYEDEYRKMIGFEGEIEV